MSLTKKQCLHCRQEVSTNDQKKVGAHTTVSAGGRTIACPGKGS